MHGVFLHHRLEKENGRFMLSNPDPSCPPKILVLPFALTVDKTDGGTTIYMALTSKSHKNSINQRSKCIFSEVISISTISKSKKGFVSISIKVMCHYITQEPWTVLKCGTTISAVF